MIPDWIGHGAAFFLPFFDIPMILRLLERKRSEDVSLIWTGGVWICTVLMSPKAFTSHDLTLKLFGISNFFLFSILAILVFYYRWRPHPTLPLNGEGRGRG